MGRQQIACKSSVFVLFAGKESLIRQLAQNLQTQFVSPIF